MRQKYTEQSWVLRVRGTCRYKHFRMHVRANVKFRMLVTSIVIKHVSEFSMALITF